MQCIRYRKNMVDSRYIGEVYWSRGNGTNLIIKFGVVLTQNIYTFYSVTKNAVLYLYILVINYGGVH